MSLLPTLLTRNINRNFLNLLCRSTAGNYWSRRNLFTEEKLGLIAFKEKKANSRKLIHDVDEFKKQIENNLAKEQEYLIYSEDLKKIVRICENDEDFQLVKKMIDRFTDQNQRIRFDDFRHGPEVIRLLHILKKPNEALSLIYNDKYNNLFLSFTCYFLVMDMLYKHKMYEEGTKVYERYLEKQIDAKKYSKFLLILYFAHIYKTGTKEALEKGFDFYKKVFDEKPNDLPKKCNLFLALLALKHNENFAAAELMSSEFKSLYTFNIKARVLAVEKRYQDILYMIQEYMMHPNSGKTKAFFCSDTLSILEKELENSDNEIKEKFKKLTAELKLGEFITTKSLEEFALEPIGTSSNNKKILPDMRNPKMKNFQKLFKFKQRNS